MIRNNSVQYSDVFLFHETYSHGTRTPFMINKKLWEILFLLFLTHYCKICAHERSPGSKVYDQTQCDV